MGLNIIVKKIIGIMPAEPGLFDPHGYGEEEDVELVEDCPWWDSLRYAGDREFITNNGFERITPESEYLRPVDIHKCVGWVNENLTDDLTGNKPRLLQLLYKMEHDPNIVLRISW